MSLYEHIAEQRKDSPELRKTIKNVLEKLEALETNREHPGMLLGMIQSGKTRAFVGVIALAFDRGYDVAVVLTKSSRALTAQTVKRLNQEFIDAVKQDYLIIKDIMEVQHLTPYQREKKLIFVVKKEDDNLRRLSNLFRLDYPDLVKKRTLMIDDEADLASVTYSSDSTAADNTKFGILGKMISDFRKSLNAASDYLQVTATPYSLYLQPVKIVVNSEGIAPLKPRFTEILHPHSAYVGGDFYFGPASENGIASYLHRTVSEIEFDKLRVKHGSYLNTILTTNNLETFRRAHVTYLCAGAIRLLQENGTSKDASAGFRPFQAQNYKSSFLLHTETGKSAHAWQKELTESLYAQLSKMASEKPEQLEELLREPYENLSASMRLVKDAIVPDFNVAKDRVIQALLRGQISVKEVNSDNDVINLLDDNGQLHLDNPFNVFIGGQVLDRGITIDNLIGFFYGRNPKTFQMDTVLQHSRMYGTRTMKDLAVTRFYTSNRIYDAMKRVHNFDSALRTAFIEKGEAALVQFIQKTKDGKVRPCSPAKTKISSLETISPHGRMNPYGFQTKAPSTISKKISEIDHLLEKYGSPGDRIFEIPEKVLVRIVEIIASTFEYSDLQENADLAWNHDGFIEAVDYCLRRKGKKVFDNVKIYWQINRDVGRLRKNENRGKYIESPADGRKDIPLCQAAASDHPVVMLLKQQGREAQDWRGAAFYWPVLIAPKNIQTCVYSEE
ncbi:MAG: Z1 domain-containing protein [Turneriella sp.]